MADITCEWDELFPLDMRRTFKDMGDGTHAWVVSLGAGALTQPFDAMREAGRATIIGPDDRVDQDEYSNSVGYGFPASHSGEILNILLISGEQGTGAILTPAGKIFVFDTDPGINAGDAVMGVDDRHTLIGMVDVAAADWQSDANGGTAYIYCKPISFHPVSMLWLCWFHEDATSFNDAAGDDETLQMNFWYRRDS